MAKISPPLGSIDGELPIIDEIVYENEKELKECSAKETKNISKYLLERTAHTRTKYLCVCVPCYNEEYEEWLKTLNSLMENFDFLLKKARLHDDAAGNFLKREIENLIPVIVPIFDGASKLSPSLRDWLIKKFPGLLDGMLESGSAVGKVDVRIHCAKWWYYSTDLMPSDEPNAELEEDYFNKEQLIYFHLLPIVKRSNHRKHNSHQWFFDSICKPLLDKVEYVFLTDCGTTYMKTCVARLLYELCFKPDLIGVTARQRVETPNRFYHPCEHTPLLCFTNNEEYHKNRPDPCWKCWLAFFCSPCPLQGFEFEATLIMNSAMFNLVEALPVMPGPCQLLNWQKMKQFNVVGEYFNLLFKGEARQPLPTKKFPKRFIPVEDEAPVETFTLPTANPLGPPLRDVPLRSISTDEVDPELGLLTSRPSFRITHQTSFRDAPATARHNEEVTFTEFLRVNMRLAEDRILSFVSVFSTGYGTKWIPGATFRYRPEIAWQSLLTQRRRWLNGTFASFIYFFVSDRAKSRILGGMFDAHKAGKNIRLVNALWSLQLMQLLLVLIGPSIFGTTIYIGALDSSSHWIGFKWTTQLLFGPVGGAELFLTLFLIIYVVWSISSYYAPGGKMPELACSLIAIAGFIFIFPVYFSVWYSIGTEGVNVVDGLVIASLLLPVVIALSQSFTSAVLYVAYLPWFLFLIVFFLIFIPSYSFARLWDTTWGNRATGDDSKISNTTKAVMMKWNFYFMIGLIVLNLVLTYSFIQIFHNGGNDYVLAFMFIAFCPMIIQLICSFLFLFIAVPLRALISRPEKSSNTGYLPPKGGIPPAEPHHFENGKRSISNGITTERNGKVE